jgi:phage gp36-like protein
MSYSTIDDVFKRYPVIDQVVGSASEQVASADVTSIYIADADSIINGYLSRRYVLPLTTEPLLTMVSADIAIYRLIEDKLPRFPQAVERRYLNAMSMIAQMQTGAINLNSSQIVTSGGDQDAWSSASSFAGTIFTPAEQITNIQSVFDPFWQLGRQGSGGGGSNCE